VIPLHRSDPLGATRGPDGTLRFRLWAPKPQRVELVLYGPAAQNIVMTELGDGYRGADVEDVPDGAHYQFRLDGGAPRADPASRGQPLDVEGPSEVVSPERFEWSDAGWAGVDRADLIFYELHVGTFSPEGTFAGVIDRLPSLAELGVTAVELLPIAAFPGTRNWGYDGVLPFAVQHSYGGIHELQRLAQACHRHQLALFVDVVYNHVGPEGSHLGEFGPYFTDGYRTPWGPAINFDGADSDQVRRYFLESAGYLVRAAHLDGLRVDAVHAIIDPTARPFLAELTDAIHAMSDAERRRVHIVAESALNDPRVVLPTVNGGLGFDAFWNDDFHHAFHALVTGERDGYYADFGSPEAVRRALVAGLVLEGQYSEYRRRRHGAPARELPPDRFVVCVQDHDQVGNRPRGERLSRLASFEVLKLAAGFLLLPPYLPLLFMGEEYGETAPFLYFTSHHDVALIERVRLGRRAGFSTPTEEGEVPDPQSPATFERSRIDFDRNTRPGHSELRALYRELIRLRRDWGPRHRWRPEDVRSPNAPSSYLVTFPPPGDERAIVTIYHFAPSRTSATVELPKGRWRHRLESSDEQWGGPGRCLPDLIDAQTSHHLEMNPTSFGVFERVE
jgi:maltooligosyltrehalose trehalohydrolase